MSDLPPIRPHRPITVPAEFDISRTRAERPPRTKTAPRAMDAETIIARLEEAGHTLLSLPRTSGPIDNRHSRHQAMAERLGALAAAECGSQLPVPPASRITRMDQALAWIPLIPADKLVLRRIVGCRCLVSPHTGRHLFSWRRLALLVGVDHKTIQNWHAAGIDLIVATLRRDAAIVESWDGLR